MWLNVNIRGIKNKVKSVFYISIMFNFVIAFIIIIIVATNAVVTE